MRHLSIATVIEKNRVHSVVAFVVALEIALRNPDTGELIETLRLVNNPDPLTIQGQVYQAAAFEISAKEETGRLPQITLTAQDQTRFIQARMQEFGGGVGSEVAVMVVNTALLDDEPEIREVFKVVGASARDYVVSFDLGAENPLQMRLPRRLQYRDRCPWRYRGVECGYAGPLPTCDYTLQGTNGCAAHNNTERFGGFPGIVNRR